MEVALWFGVILSGVPYILEMVKCRKLIIGIDWHIGSVNVQHHSMTLT